MFIYGSVALGGKGRYILGDRTHIQKTHQVSIAVGR